MTSPVAVLKQVLARHPFQNKGYLRTEPQGTDWDLNNTSANGDDAPVTLSSETDTEHHISTIIASFETDNQSGRLEVTCGTETILELFIIDKIDIEFSTPLDCGAGEDITATLYNGSNAKASIFMAGYRRKV